MIVTQAFGALEVSFLTVVAAALQVQASALVDAVQ
jgi:hypothetical protein